MEGLNLNLQLGAAEWAVIALCVVVGFFFFFGSWFNNRLSQQSILWLRKGLSEFGQLKQLRLSMPTATGMAIKAVVETDSPLAVMEGNLILSHRENLPYWLFQLAQGRFDELDLFIKQSPKHAVEIRANINHDKPGRPVLETPSQNTLHLSKYGTAYSIYHQGDPNHEAINQVKNLLDAYPLLFTVVQLQQKSPGMVLRIRLIPLLKVDPIVFFQSIQTLFQ